MLASQYPQHAMIDLETLGKSAGAVILSAGVVLFRPGLLRMDGDRFDWSDWDADIATKKVKIDRVSCEAIGLTIDPETEAWWNDQSEEARADAFGFDPNRLPIADALNEIADFLRTSLPGKDGTYAGRIWSHGAPFDFPILSAALRKAGIAEPWNFRAVRDTRTIFDAAGLSYSGTAHEPVADAMAQARVVSQSLFLIDTAFRLSSIDQPKVAMRGAL